MRTSAHDGGLAAGLSIDSSNAPTYPDVSRAVFKTVCGLW